MTRRAGARGFEERAPRSPNVRCVCIRPFTTHRPTFFSYTPPLFHSPRRWCELNKTLLRFVFRFLAGGVGAVVVFLRLTPAFFLFFFAEPTDGFFFQVFGIVRPERISNLPPGHANWKYLKTLTDLLASYISLYCIKTREIGRGDKGGRHPPCPFAISTRDRREARGGGGGQ